MTQSDEFLHGSDGQFAAVAYPGPRENRRWFVVHARPHAESRAIVNLRRQGYRVFCPRLRKTVRHARKTSVSLVPLFPGYLFLDLDVSHERWRSVNGTYGVIRLIMQGDAPLPVPRGVVEVLLGEADGEGCVGRDAPLKPGQRVRIWDGPFAGFVATLEELDQHGRVRVLLQLLGRSVSVGLHGEVLSAAE